MNTLRIIKTKMRTVFYIRTTVICTFVLLWSNCERLVPPEMVRINRNSFKKERKKCHDRFTKSDTKLFLFWLFLSQILWQKHLHHLGTIQEMSPQNQCCGLQLPLNSVQPSILTVTEHRPGFFLHIRYKLTPVNLQSAQAEKYLLHKTAMPSLFALIIIRRRI